MKHILIVGEQGVGKSTLLQKIVSQIGRPAFGFESVKADEAVDEENGSPIHVYEIKHSKRCGAPHLTGYCKRRHMKPIDRAFDCIAPILTQEIPTDGIWVLDELGVMEHRSNSQAFCSAVLARLDGNTPVIAAVKAKSNPFLEAVRTHPNAKCFSVTPENRELLEQEILAECEVWRTSAKTIHKGL